MKKAIIAITADQLVEPSAVINQVKADFSPNDLKEAIFAAGGIPIVLPFPEDTTRVEETTQALVKTFDGLVIPGGPDLDPINFGEEPIAELGRSNYKRDAFELALVKAAQETGKPILGICRGLQLINVALGGTLYQDLAVQYPQIRIKHAQAAPGEQPTHHVAMSPGSYLYQLFGDSAYVNSRHHQAAHKIAKGLTVVATSPDGVIEALESSDGEILAVQWHPENMWREHEEQFKLFEDFVKRSSH
ncbi:MAG: gamma-glutamyl-gamma-aminobutyrate hydrolase family protein [Streptococcaceae bacterium]|jgi:putative glutamine amidotransferase|nr:gamma-glutamyl-gamma-aminobutyrate hydrolase family protein [Streptococcaceae bacterium]